MGKTKIIEVKESVFADNDREAALLREELKEKKSLLINLMSSPGSGKTSFLSRLINDIKERINIAVMEADIDSDVDARKIDEATGVRAIQLHTGGMCHLTAAMTRQGLEALPAEGFDLIFLENVGNLVCPAEFDTGAAMNMTILSVPEGDDKPLKYPLMYQVCDLVVINKIDTLPVFDFDVEKAKENIRMRNPKAEVFCVSAKTGEGFPAVEDWILKKAASL